MKNKRTQQQRRELALQRLSRRRMLQISAGATGVLASSDLWALDPLDDRCRRTHWLLGSTTIRELFGGAGVGKPFKEILSGGLGNDPNSTTPPTNLTAAQERLVNDLINLLTDDFYFRYFYTRNRAQWPTSGGGTPSQIVAKVGQLREHFVQPHWLHCQLPQLGANVRNSCRDLLDNWEGIDETGATRTIVGVIHQFGDMTVKEVFESRHVDPGAAWKNEALIPAMKRLRMPWIDDRIDLIPNYPSTTRPGSAELAQNTTEKDKCTGFTGATYFCSQSPSTSCVFVGGTNDPAAGTDYCLP